MKNFYLFFLITFFSISLGAQEKSNNVAYEDTNVRFTVISDGTIRMEYAPDGKFINQHSFLAVERNYPAVKFKLKKGAWIELSTSKMKLRYKKNSGAFTAENLQISSMKGLTPAFVWKPGMKQQYNLKGTTRTLDGWDGDKCWGHKADLEDGLLAKDGWTCLDDSNNFLFDGDADNWNWVKTREHVEGAQDWYFMAYGHDYKAALKDYTLFAGRMPLPPRYAFGYWWSRYWMYSDHELRELCKNFENYNIPLDVLVIDMDWHYTDKGRGSWTGWTWNKELFPDYRKLLKDLKADNGLRVTLNLHPAEGVRSYEEQYEAVARDNGVDPATKQEIPWISSKKSFIKSMFKNVLMPMNNAGIDFWWLDWQQEPFDKEVKNLSNTWWLNYIFFSQMERERQTRPLIYHRWGGLGNHRYQVGFSGDTFISWASLDYQTYFNSTASNVLYGYWSHDIGGHNQEGANDAELYLRWIQYGVFSPILRTHATAAGHIERRIWKYANFEQMRDAIYLRYALIPYIYTMARWSYDTGVGMCRPMYYDYPEADEAYRYEGQYMFGNDILVAPVTSSDKGTNVSEKDIWLPEGKWYEVMTGELIDGGSVVTRSFTREQIPYYYREGAIIPLYPRMMHLKKRPETLTLQFTPGARGEFNYYEDAGNNADYQTACTFTRITQNTEDGRTSCTIYPRTGSFDDMPEERAYRLEFLARNEAPTKVTFSDGTHAVYEYDAEGKKIVISVPKRACSSAITVIIE